MKNWIKYSLKHYGLGLTVVIITLISIVASVSISFAIRDLWLGQGMSPQAWFVSIVCPALIAPPMSFFSLRLVMELESVRERLLSLARRDPLTGAYNRRYFMEKLGEEIERANRYGAQLSVAFIDIDDFKGINDQYGHLVGDEVLRRLSAICAAQLRQIDLFARIGGEEFGVILPETTGAEGTHLLERLRDHISATHIAHPEGMLSVTVSIGLTNLEDKVPSLNMVLRQADEALYIAKRQGKNKVVWQRFDASLSAAA